MQLSPAKFNGLLSNLGQDIYWRRSYACPCRNVYSDAAVQGCPSCHGKGIFWGDPQPAYVGLSGMKVQQQWAQYGAYEQGDIVVTLPSDTSVYNLADYDRIAFSDSTVGFDQIFRRGIDDDPLPFPVYSIERVFWLHADGATIIEGTIPLADSGMYLRWPGLQPIKPADEQQYSMTGRKNTEYFVAVSSMVQDRAHHHGASLPRKCVLRRWDLYGR